MEEDLELWFRDPVECVQELLSNPVFVEHTAFALERVYSDREGKERIFDEMWTAEWWWDTQVGLTWAVVIR
jgi:Plavaka transposase